MIVKAPCIARKQAHHRRICQRHGQGTAQQDETGVQACAPVRYDVRLQCARRQPPLDRAALTTDPIVTKREEAIQSALDRVLAQGEAQRAARQAEREAEAAAAPQPMESAAPPPAADECVCE